MKPKEWWIAQHELDDFILHSEPFGTHSSKYTHVIEYSAYGDAMEHLAAMVHAPDSQCFSEARVRAEQFLKSCNGEDK